MKSFCILEQGRSVGDPLTEAKRKIFTTEFSDFYRLNWESADDKNAFLHRDNIVWSEGRALLYESVPKDYEYYIFIDDDIEFSCLTGDVPVAIKCFFEEYKPLTGTFVDVERFISPMLYNFMGGLDLKSCLARDVFPVAGYDQQLQFFSHSYAKVMFPAPYHGAGMSMWYSQWACAKQFPGKQLCFTGVHVINTRAETHLNEKRKQHLPGDKLVSLFNSNVLDKSFCWNLKEIKLQNNMAFEVDVDSSLIEYDIADFAKIYDLSNSFYQNRAATVIDVDTYLEAIEKKSSSVAFNFRGYSSINMAMIEEDRASKLSNLE